MTEQVAESRKILIRELETSQQGTIPFPRLQSEESQISKLCLFAEGEGCDGAGEDGGGEGDLGEGQRARLGGAGHPTGARQGEKHDDQRGPRRAFPFNLGFDVYTLTGDGQICGTLVA